MPKHASKRYRRWLRNRRRRDEPIVNPTRLSAEVWHRVASRLENVSSLLEFRRACRFFSRLGTPTRLSHPRPIPSEFVLNNYSPERREGRNLWEWPSSGVRPTRDGDGALISMFPAFQQPCRVRVLAVPLPVFIPNARLFLPSTKATEGAGALLHSTGAIESREDLLSGAWKRATEAFRASGYFSRESSFAAFDAMGFLVDEPVEPAVHFAVVSFANDALQRTLLKDRRSVTVLAAEPRFAKNWLTREVDVLTSDFLLHSSFLKWRGYEDTASNQESSHWFYKLADELPYSIGIEAALPAFKPGFWRQLHLAWTLRTEGKPCFFRIKRGVLIGVHPDARALIRCSSEWFVRQGDEK